MRFSRKLLEEIHCEVHCRLANRKSWNRWLLRISEGKDFKTEMLPNFVFFAKWKAIKSILLANDIEMSSNALEVVGAHDAMRIGVRGTVSYWKKIDGFGLVCVYGKREFTEGKEVFSIEGMRSFGGCRKKSKYPLASV